MLKSSYLISRQPCVFRNNARILAIGKHSLRYLGLGLLTALMTAFFQTLLASLLPAYAFVEALAHNYALFVHHIFSVSASFCRRKISNFC